MTYKKISLAVILTLSQLITIPHDGILPYAFFIFLIGAIPYRIAAAGVLLFLYWYFISFKILHIIFHKLKERSPAIKYFVVGILFIILYYLAMMLNFIIFFGQSLIQSRFSS